MVRITASPETKQSVKPTQLSGLATARVSLNQSKYEVLTGFLTNYENRWGADIPRGSGRLRLALSLKLIL